MLAKLAQWAIAILMLLGVFGSLVLWQKTVNALHIMPSYLVDVIGDVDRVQVVDRYGQPLNTTYANEWNVHDSIPLYEIPDFLVNAFIYAEDKRFFNHSGQDWIARFSALARNTLSLSLDRGASTITEQVVRMIRPRPRTVWSRWLEGWEAQRLERQHSKTTILEFYLNQVPYAENRRGVVQAARYYFDRDLDTLSRHEMMALAVLVRAPSRLDPWYGDIEPLYVGIARLANQLSTNHELDNLLTQEEITLDLKRSSLQVDARHFVRRIRTHSSRSDRKVRTTLDGVLQTQVQMLLNQRLRFMRSSDVQNGAVLIADHRKGEVIAWAVGSTREDTPDYLIDAVRVPRQPGSTLKPFLYALALEQGWTAATMINDSPMKTKVGYGLHEYNNYSGRTYGPVTLRQALGNSLNIPAVRTLQFMGILEYVDLLSQLGFKGLTQKLDFYGNGLALGNGEVTLFELVQAYCALANRGIYRTLSLRFDGQDGSSPIRVFSPEVASLIGDILSDQNARNFEFDGGLLNFPQQTAVKTGTSSDHRDSWVVGYNDEFAAGIWMGNLDQKPMQRVTGSTGPALLLRSTFDLLNRYRDTKSLWLSPRLEKHSICINSSVEMTDKKECHQRDEYFVRGTGPSAPAIEQWTPQKPKPVAWIQPTEDLQMAIDPRIPIGNQMFEFRLVGVEKTDQVRWKIKEEESKYSLGSTYLWPLKRGSHSVRASVWRQGELLTTTEAMPFSVK